jgi:hypothetical protein
MAYKQFVKCDCGHRSKNPRICLGRFLCYNCWKDTVNIIPLNKIKINYEYI